MTTPLRLLPFALSFALSASCVVAGCAASGTKGQADSGGSTGAPEMALVADFNLEDLNPNSARSGEVVSPRDYLEHVSGWYFIHAT